MRGMMMSDPNIEEFYGRVARIERDHANGVSFVAEGTLGRVPERRSARRGAALIRSFAFLMVLLVAFKAVLMDQVGEATYRDKIAALQSGSVPERISGAIIAPDALSVWLAGLIGRL